MPNNPEPPDEILQVFDEYGAPTQALPRAIVKAEPRQHWHGVANIWLINQRGEILVTKRSSILKSKPNLWQSYIGGHLKAGQSFLEAAIAESQEEVGLTIDPGKLFLVSKVSSPKYLCHFESYIYPFDGEITDLVFNDGEIAAARWLTLDAYLKENSEKPDEWCNSIHPEHETVIRAWISEHSGEVKKYAD
jgi:isopentenyldiphosphate isomerase